jgi:peroxiredoxin Q/BCP
MLHPFMKLRPLIALMSLFSFLFAFAKGEPLQVGAAAPTVSGITDSGTTLNLGDVYKKNNYTVVWFYPRALTGGCTAQGCSLRDANAELKKHGVAVVGVSTDTVEKQKEFKEKNTFDYPLIADTDHKVMQAFGQADKATASREAYLVDKTGKIVYKDTGVTGKQAENILNFLGTKKG